MNQVTTTPERSLASQLTDRGIDFPQWRTLANNLYPGASQQSVLMVIDYCIARGLDPLKKPCHIVPMQVSVPGSHKKIFRDVVLPGIYELRTTAQRTREYMGHEQPQYGAEIEYLGVKAPEYCDFVVYRWNTLAQQKAAFPVRVWFAEAVGTYREKGGGKEHVNARWAKAPKQMLTKCAEAAALREGFPDHIGGQMAAEEVEGQESYTPAPPRPTSTSLDEIMDGEIRNLDPPGEPEEPGAPEAPIEAGAPSVSAEELRAQITGAKNVDALNEAMDLIATIESDDERQALRALAIQQHRSISQ